MTVSSPSPTVLLCMPCLRAGGTEFQTLTMAGALAADGWQVRLLVYYDEIDDVMLREFNRTAAEVIELKLSRAISLPRLLFRLVGILRDMSPDVVHVQYMAPGFTPVIAARFAGCRRILATVHQSAFAHGSRARRLLRAAASMCNVFFCNSLATEQSWFGQSRLYDREADRFPRGHYTLYNGVDVAGIAETTARTDRLSLLAKLGFDRVPIVGVVGRLRWEKGQKTAIRALRSLLRDHPSAGLLIVGDGPDRERLEQLCRDLGVDPAVRFTGALSHEQVRALYGAMDVLAVPSIHEGFCLAAAEAMAAHVPIVASDIPALSEILAHGKAGILTASGDSEALASGLRRMLSDTDLHARIRTAAFAHTERFFSKPVFDRNAAAIHRAML